ncbi:MAG: hypothetical protein Q7S31_02805 [bacterium]|nr:hypothetical protein [bacterium]
MSNLLAANLGTLEGLGPLGQIGADLPTALSSFSRIISVTIGILTISAGTWFIIQMFMGAFQWLSSGGDKQGAENARKRLTNAVIGLFIVVASYALISLVGLVFGFDILSPAKVFNTVISTP